jgi:cardiolipin synthase A/B
LNKNIGIALACLLLGAAGSVGAGSFIPDDPALRHALEHTYSAAQPEFTSTMQGFLGEPIEAGNKIETLANGDETFPAMLKAIAGAEKTVNFETYIFWSGEIAERFADALSERGRAGVRVNVILDYVGSIPMEQRLIDRMRNANVRVIRLRPIHWYTMDQLNHRSHRKVLIVDGRVGFTGGVGIADQWRGDAGSPNEWRDNHYLIEGVAVAGLQSSFTEHWLEATGEILRGGDYFPDLKRPGFVSLQPMKSSPFSGSEQIYLGLMMALSAAEHHIRIGMAYFVPNEAALEQILDARRRGVEVDIILPGTWTDTEEVRRASRYFWGQLLEAGVKIYEYQPTMYHVKIVMVDENWATLGSANFDERSFRLNDETNVNVYDRGFVLQQIALFELDRSRSRPVTLAQWQGRPMRVKISDWFWSRFRSYF